MVVVGTDTVEAVKEEEGEAGMAAWTAGRDIQGRAEVVRAAVTAVDRVVGAAEAALAAEAGATW